MNIIILLILVIIQAINWIFIVISPLTVRPIPLEAHTPLFILFIISLIILGYIFYFERLIKDQNSLKLRNKTNYQENIENDGQNKIPPKSSSITETLYSINDMVSILQILFIIAIIFSIFYLIWFIGVFIHDLKFVDIFSLRNPIPPPIGARIPPPPPIIRFANYISIISLIFFLIVNLRYFKKWYNKKNKISTLEKKIFDELKLDW